MNIQPVNGAVRCPVRFQYGSFEDQKRLSEDDAIMKDINEFLLNNSCMHIIQLRSYVYISIFLSRKQKRRKLSVESLKVQTERYMERLVRSGAINRIDNIVYPHRETGANLLNIRFRSEDMMAVWYEIYLKYSASVGPESIVRKAFPSEFEDMQYVKGNRIHSVKVVPWKEMFDGDELEPHRRMIRHFTDIDEAPNSIIPGFSQYVRESTVGLYHDYLFRSEEQARQFQAISRAKMKNWHEKRNTSFYVLDTASTKGQYPIPKFLKIE